MPTVPKLFLLDDEDSFTLSFRALATSIGVDVVRIDSADFSSGPFHGRDFGCVVLDLSKFEPGISRLLDEAKLPSALPLIVLTDDAPVSLVVKAARAGAAAFLQQHRVGRSEILEAIQVALKVDKQRKAIRARRDDVRERFELLSDAERRIIDLLFAGNEIVAIAAQLDVSRHTVEKHRNNLMLKLKTKTFPDLIALIVEFRDDAAPRNS